MMSAREIVYSENGASCGRYLRKQRNVQECVAIKIPNDEVFPF